MFAYICQIWTKYVPISIEIFCIMSMKYIWKCRREFMVSFITSSLPLFMCPPAYIFLNDISAKFVGNFSWNTFLLDVDKMNLLDIVEVSGMLAIILTLYLLVLPPVYKCALLLSANQNNCVLFWRMLKSGRCTWSTDILNKSSLKWIEASEVNGRPTNPNLSYRQLLVLAPFQFCPRQLNLSS